MKYFIFNRWKIVSEKITGEKNIKNPNKTRININERFKISKGESRGKRAGIRRVLLESVRVWLYVRYNFFTLLHTA